ncbi:lipopolysaccharide kinase InaA family protein [Porphyromonas sp.]
MAKVFASNDTKDLLRHHSINPEGEALLRLLLDYIRLYEEGCKQLPQEVRITEIYRGRNVLYRVTCPEGDYTVKHFGRLSPLRQLYYGWTNTSKARRSLLNALQLCAYQIATPEPIGYVEERNSWGGLVDSYYVTRYIDFTGDSLQHEARSGEVNEPLTRALADFLTRLHDCGVVHEDLSPGNIPYIYERAREEYTFMLVDLNRMHFTATPLSLGSSIRNMERLFAHPRATEALGKAYATARGYASEEVLPALEKACDAFWLHRLPKLALRYAQRNKGITSATFLTRYSTYLRWRRLRHLCPIKSWCRVLHLRESAFYTTYLEPEDVRRALARREGYPHTPLP